MGKYASDTKVSAEKSRAEIERTLIRYGADSFVYANFPTHAIVMFQLLNRRIKFMVPLPDKSSPEFTRTPHKNQLRSDDAALRAWEQACRQKWRALNLCIKAKLEAVDAGISEFDDEFLANILLPDGQTMGEWSKPQIKEAYQIGVMPSMLPLSGPAS